MAERRVARGVEMQHQLAQLQEEMKKLKLQLAANEEEKSKILGELEEVKKEAKEENSNFRTALAAQKHAEEGWEAEKVRVKELEQASVESAQKREQAWQLELEAMQTEHSLDVQALASATQELDRLNRELYCALKDKKTAHREAEAARTVAEANSKRVKELLMRLESVKVPLSRANSGLASQASFGNDMAPLLDLERALKAEVTSLESELCIEKLKLELTNDGEPFLEPNAPDPLTASSIRIQKLEEESAKARESEAKTFESLVSQTKQLEKTKISLEEAKLEIASLQNSTKSLEASVKQRNRDLSASHKSLELAKLETNSVRETVEFFKSELQLAKRNLAQAEERERLAQLNARNLSEEMNLLRNELRLSTEAEEKSKKAMDGLALALKEVTTEANQAKESLSSAEEAVEKAGMDVDRYKLRLMRTEDKYKGLLEHAKRETEDTTRAARQENTRLREALKQAMHEASTAKEAAEFAATENSQLRDNLSQMGSMMERVKIENECLQHKVGAGAGAAAAAAVAAEGAAAAAATALTAEPENGTDPPGQQPPEVVASSESEHMKKSNTMSERRARRSRRFLSGPLRRTVPPAEIEPLKPANKTKDEDYDSDASKGSIFDTIPEHDDDHRPVPIMTHRRAASAVILDEVHFYDLEPIDGSIYDETEAGSLDAKQKKKRALLGRFGGMLRKKSTHK
ncbi:hypothetical protein ACLOJK_016359 [Asimina triloba]